MNKREQAFCTSLGKWWDYIGHKVFPNSIIVCEAKISTGTKPLNYKGGFRPHQIDTLLMYKKKPSHWKISDGDSSTKMFDILMTNPTKDLIPCVAVMWIRRGNKDFYLIDPDVIQGRIDDGHKSLGEEEAKGLCFYKGVIK